VLLGLGLGVSLAASAQVPRADVEQLWLDPAARGSLFVGSGETLPARGVRIGVALSFGEAPLRSVAEGTGTALIAERLGLQVFGAVGVLDWLQLGAVVPVVAAQQGAASLALAPAGLGNPWLHAKARLLGGAGARTSAAVDVGVGVPVGTAVAQGNGGLAFAPRVQAGHRFEAFLLSGELGLLMRSPVDYGGLGGGQGTVLGSQLFGAVAVSGLPAEGPRGEVSVRAFAPLGGGRAGVEGQVGVRWPVGPVEVFASAGPGFGGEPGTPRVRAYAGVALANVPLTSAPCVEGRPYELAACPALDRDGDGVPNGSDAAPEVAEDRDGFEDGDGAPDPDDDRDGVLDAEDRCVREAGPSANGGCPDTDADGDGVVDRLDRCVKEPEDRDDFEDGDGCPEVDNDGDGFPDGQDACPGQAGIAPERGCPAKDSDGDQVFDHEDNCPVDAGAKDNAGCPAAQKQRVVIAGAQLRILDKVYFDAGKASIQARSFALLDNVAQVLTAHPELRRVRIEGHTDASGDAQKNTALSQARAEAVKAHLVKAGVAAERLEAQGFGPTRPAQSNDTKEGREANRRVEFSIVAE
jgi:outer membrane protein OmpA-like peptidoglycan-associated protein